MPIPIPTDEIEAHADFQSARWQTLHRFQGFCAIEEWTDQAEDGDEQVQRGHRYFKGIAMPEGPDSLWHALSYLRGG